MMNYHKHRLRSIIFIHIPDVNTCGTNIISLLVLLYTQNDQSNKNIHYSNLISASSHNIVLFYLTLFRLPDLTFSTLCTILQNFQPAKMAAFTAFVFDEGRLKGVLAEGWRGVLDWEWVVVMDFIFGFYGDILLLNFLFFH